MNIKENNWYYCTDCKPNWNCIGEFNKNYFLIHDVETDQYLIGDIGGHADAIYTFPMKPTKDPLNLIDEMEDGNDEMYDLQIEWIRSTKEYENTFVFEPSIGYNLYRSFIKSGWKQDTHGYLYLYIVHTAAVLIEKYEQRITQLHPESVGK